MARVTYSVKDTNIEVNIGAKDTSASICWIGITTTEETCWSCSEESSYCESVYVGENTSCTETAYTGTFEWHEITISYTINQERADCLDCGTETTYCDIIDYYVDPYYVNYNTTSVTVYYNYWETKEDKCGITRERKKTSTSVSIDPSTITCDATNRELDVSFTDACGVSHTAKCYVQKPDICCDDPNKVCYVINDIYYSPSIVPSSGANVSFYFDYKKKEIVDCVEKITFGRYEGTWKISACDSDEEKATQRCCRDHIEKIKISELEGNVWTDEELCSGGLVKNVELSIIQIKNPTYSGDCSNICDPDTGYCVDNQTIKSYYKDAYGNWILWGQIGVSSEGSSWNWVDENYEIPYYGGSMKVTWEYSAITIYDDCTSGVTSGNIYEDIVDILPYDGEDCYDETKCYNVTLASQNGNKCDGGSATFSAAPNTSQKKYTEKELEYVFRKSPCSFKDSAKSVLPPNLVTCGEGEKECNEFEVPYKQSKKPCNDSCGTCVTTSRYTLSSTTSSSFDDSYSGCEIKLIDNPYWITVNVGNGTISYSVEANTGSDREGGVTYQVNGMNCYDTVIIWQHGDESDKDSHDEDPEVECDCATATFEAYPASVLPSTSSQHIVVGSYIYDDCITDVDVEGGGGTTCTIAGDSSIGSDGGTIQLTASESSGGGTPSWLSNFDCKNGFIYADVTENTDSQNERVGNIEVTYSTDKGQCGSSTIQVKQNKGGCNLTLISDGTEICQSDGGSVTFTPQYGI